MEATAVPQASPLTGIGSLVKVAARAAAAIFQLTYTTVILSRAKDPSGPASAAPSSRIPLDTSHGSG
jgi:hypothetical protein